MCDECPLKGSKQVLAEPTIGLLAIVGEAPGKDELKKNRYFVGESGKRLRGAFDYFGIPHGRVHINNTLRCKAPSKMSEKDWSQATACCRPRLVAELEKSQCKQILTLGKRAFRSLTRHKNAAIIGGQRSPPWLGGYIPADNVHNIPLIPTIHPAFCLRGSGQYWPVFYAHLKRAWRLASGKEQPFQWPRLYYYGSDPEETVNALEEIFASKSGTYVGFDIETAGFDSVRDPFTAIGLATHHVSVSISWPPNKHFTRHYSDMRYAHRAEHLIREILAREDLPKVAQNGGYDVLGLEAKGFDVVGYTDDTLLMHHAAAPSLRHNLGFLAQLYFAVDPWKRLFKGFKNADPHELTLYNAKDAAILPYLRDELELELDISHRGHELYAGYMERSKIAMSMQQRGIRIDPDRVAAHSESALRDAEHHKCEFLALAEKHWAGPKDLNINSDVQLKKLIYQVLGVEVTRRTEKGSPSLDKDALGDLLSYPDETVRALAKALRKYRKSRDLYTKVLKNLTWDPETLHIYPTPKIYGTRTGRWSYDDPNVQTIPSQLRDIVRASPGGYVIEADYSQLELRIIAIEAEDRLLLQWFADKLDVHHANTVDLFGDYSKDLRRLSKAFVYKLNYSDGDDAYGIWKQLKVNHPRMTLEYVKKIVALWFIKHPAIKCYRKKLLEIACDKDRDYVEAPISGRRLYFFGDVEPNKVYNHPIQATGSDIIDAAIPKIYRDIKRLKNTHLILQIHDALVLDTADPIGAAEILQEHMTAPVTLRGKEWRFPIDFKLGRNWGPKSDTNPHGQIEFESVEKIKEFMESQ
jgi:DNA polymerase-1